MIKNNLRPTELNSTKFILNRNILEHTRFIFKTGQEKVAIKVKKSKPKNRVAKIKDRAAKIVKKRVVKTGPSTPIARKALKAGAATKAEAKVLREGGTVIKDILAKGKPKPEQNEKREKAKAYYSRMNNSLKKIPFVKSGTKVQPIDIKKPYKPFTPGSPLGDGIDSALKNENVKFGKEDELNVIAVNFNKIGARNRGAFYIKDYKGKSIMVVPQNPSVISETNIPHEAFHHYFERLRGLNGSGPSDKELLEAAVAGVGKKLPNYGAGGDISTYLKGVDMKNPIAVKKAFQGVFDKDGNIRNRSKKTNGEIGHNGIPDKEWKRLPSKQRVKILKEVLKKDRAYQFVNEYWARAYNGVMGNTPKSVMKRFKETGTPIPSNFDSIYHNPSERDKAMLKRMKAKGQPIF